MVDGITRVDTDGGLTPWYHSLGYRRIAFEPVPYVLHISDAPGKDFVDGTLTKPNPNTGNFEPPSSCRVLIEFKTYLAAQTIQTQNGANQIFTQRAKFDWRFGGVGELGPGGNFAAQGLANGDPAVVNVSTGVVVPVTGGTSMNDAGDLDTFQWVPWP